MAQWGSIPHLLQSVKINPRRRKCLSRQRGTILILYRKDKKSIMVVLELIMVIFAILQIILFFKLWGMTNNVRNIREMLQCYIKDNALNKDGEVKKEDNIAPVRLPVDEYIGKWGKYVTEEEIEKVKEMLPKLPQSIFSIIKIESTGKIKVLSDLSNIEESYKVLYYTEYQRIK